MKLEFVCSPLCCCDIFQRGCSGTLGMASVFFPRWNCVILRMSLGCMLRWYLKPVYLLVVLWRKVEIAFSFSTVGLGVVLVRGSMQTWMLWSNSSIEAKGQKGKGYWNFKMWRQECNLDKWFCVRVYSMVH